MFPAALSSVVSMYACMRRHVSNVGLQMHASMPGSTAFGPSATDCRTGSVRKPATPTMASSLPANSGRGSAHRSTILLGYISWQRCACCCWCFALRAAHCMLLATCCVLQAARFLPHATCCVLHAACCMLHAACCVLHCNRVWQITASMQAETLHIYYNLRHRTEPTCSSAKTLVPLIGSACMFHHCPCIASGPPIELIHSVYHTSA